MKPVEKKIRQLHDAVNGSMIQDAEINEVTKYSICAMYFGWTPAQLDEEDAVFTDYMVEFAMEAKKRNQEPGK
jgi:uncharacterized protein YfaS (alpha-2-macroglobulin family)